MKQVKDKKAWGFQIRSPEMLDHDPLLLDFVEGKDLEIMKIVEETILTFHLALSHPDEELPGDLGDLEY